MDLDLMAETKQPIFLFHTILFKKHFKRIGLPICNYFVFKYCTIKNNNYLHCSLGIIHKRRHASGGGVDIFMTPCFKA